MVTAAPKRAAATIVEKCIVDGGRGAVRIFKRPVGDCTLLLKTREVEALVFELKWWVGLRDLIDICSRVFGFQSSNTKASVTSVTKLGSLVM